MELSTLGINFLVFTLYWIASGTIGWLLGWLRLSIFKVPGIPNVPLNIKYDYNYDLYLKTHCLVEWKIDGWHLIISGPFTLMTRLLSFLSSVLRFLKYSIGKNYCKWRNIPFNGPSKFKYVIADHFAWLYPNYKNYDVDGIQELFNINCGRLDFNSYISHDKYGNIYFKGQIVNNTKELADKLKKLIVEFRDNQEVDIKDFIDE